MRITILSLGILAFSGAAFAETSTFNNHLSSSPIVSPAQLYQVQDMKTDFSLGYKSSTESAKPKGVSEVETSGTDTGLFAGAIYNVKSIGLRTGLTVNYGMTELSQDNPDPAISKKLKTEGTEVTLTPQLAYPVGPVVLGVAVDVVQRAAKVEDQKEQKSTHNTFRPGVLFANDAMEAGLTYSSPNRVTAKDPEKDLAITEAAVVTAHGRYAIASNMKAGAILAHTNYKAVDKDLFRDRTSGKGTFEYGLSQVQIEGEVGYNSAFYRSENNGMSDETIGTIVLGAAADYEVSQTATVGGGFGYEFGSDKNDAVEYAKNELTVAVRGNMKF